MSSSSIKQLLRQQYELFLITKHPQTSSQQCYDFSSSQNEWLIPSNPIIPSWFILLNQPTLDVRELIKCLYKPNDHLITTASIIVISNDLRFSTISSSFLGCPKYLISSFQSLNTKTLAPVIIHFTIVKRSISPIVTKCNKSHSVCASHNFPQPLSCWLCR